jgi:hypothetical protein
MEMIKTKREVFLSYQKHVSATYFKTYGAGKFSPSSLRFAKN